MLNELASGAIVLDLGCKSGSFAANGPYTVVRLDLERPIGGQGSLAVQGDAAMLPFADEIFDVVVSNHSLEHFVHLEAALREVGRVLRSNGSFYVAVPDATTLTDKLYRWLARGGGHVNAFTSPQQVVSAVERWVGIRLVATRQLHTSLSFLHHRLQPARTTRKLWLFLNGNEAYLRLVNGLLRVSDRILGTRLSVYGWALYFGEIRTRIEVTPRVNVCVRCGSGHGAEFLLHAGAVKRVLVWKSFRCPDCGCWNYFFSERGFSG